MAQVRAPTQPPSPPQHRQLQILFRNPGYDDGNNVLFKLQAPDTDNDGQAGLFAQFAIDACAIIAGNSAGRGWLSLSRDGIAPIDPTSTLRKRSYYFHLDAADGVDYPYAIVPNFRQWSYPHDLLPLHWQQLASHSNSALSGITLAPSNLTTALLMRDGSCRLSGCREQLQVAHVVPQSELDWWRANDMSRYNTGSSATLDDTANALLLRADLHIAFDKPRVAFVPKPVTDGSMRLVAHLLDHSPELEHLYHNRELHPTAVGVDMLYARFAWSIFTLLDAFLECRIDRRLALRTSDARLADARGFVTAVDCELFATAATRKRSQSPKKRKQDRDSVTELERPAKTPTKTIGKRIFTTKAENMSPDPISTKRARGNLPFSDSTSRDLLSPSPPSLTHPPIDSPLSPPDACSFPSPRAPSLAKVWLENERQRSDPGDEWKQECAWRQHIWDGKTLSSDEVPRWFEVCGVEIRDAWP